MCSMLLIVLAVSAMIVLESRQHPPFVVRLAAGAIFVDLIGLVLTVWKIVFSPAPHGKESSAGS
jgi:hypothetical protein